MTFVKGWNKTGGMRPGHYSAWMQAADATLGKRGAYKELVLSMRAKHATYLQISAHLHDQGVNIDPAGIFRQCRRWAQLEEEMNIR